MNPLKHNSILFTACICFFFSSTAFAQTTSEKYEWVKSAKKDTTPTIEKEHWGFGFIYGISYNAGTHFSPIMYDPEENAGMDYETYASTGETYKNFYGFGADYQFKRSDKGFFVDIGFWYNHLAYSGTSNETQSYFNPAKPTIITSVRIIPWNYSWIISAIDIPFTFNYAFLKNTHSQLFISLGFSPLCIIHQTNNSEYDPITQDAFNFSIMLNSGLGYEHSIGKNHIIKLSPKYMYGLTISPAGRRLASAGIEATLLL